jgi:hypothetical protein
MFFTSWQVIRSSGKQACVFMFFTCWQITSISCCRAGVAVQQLCRWFHTLGMNSGSATSRNMLEESKPKKIKIVTFCFLLFVVLEVCKTCGGHAFTSYWNLVQVKIDLLQVCWWKRKPLQRTLEINEVVEENKRTHQNTEEKQNMKGWNLWQKTL